MLIEKMSFPTYDEGMTYMKAFAKKLRADGYAGTLHLKIDNFGGTPVIFTVKGTKGLS